MQGSFWKTVAVVGVIGIGSMVILEVQNSLSRRDSAAATTEPSLEQLVADVGQPANAELSDSEFEQLLKGEPTGSAAVIEPPRNKPVQTVAALAPTPDPDHNVFNSEPVAAQNAMPPMDTLVHADQLTEGGNPFADDAAAVAANYQEDPTQTADQVKPVGFLQLQPTPKPVAAQTPATEQEPAAEPASTPAFENAFGVETFAAEPEPKLQPESQPAAAAPQPVQTAQLNATPNAKSKFAFFPASDGSEKITASEPQPQPQSQPRPATQTAQQFFGDDVPADGTNPGRGLNPAAGFDSTSPMFDGAPEFGTSEPPPQTPSTVSPDSATRDFGSSTFSDDDKNNSATPFEETVPLPRPEPGRSEFGGPEFGGAEPGRSEFGFESPPAQFPAGRAPESEPVRNEVPDQHNSLPFVDDDPVSPRQVPELERPGTLAIPGLGTRPADSQRSNSEFGSPQNRNFDAQPELQPRNDRPLSAPRNSDPLFNERPANNGVREFNGGTDFDLRQKFDSSPERTNNGTREFRPESREFGSGGLGLPEQNLQQGPPRFNDQNFNDRGNPGLRLDNRQPAGQSQFDERSPARDFQPLPDSRLRDDRSLDPPLNSNERGFERSDFDDRDSLRDQGLRPVAGSMHPNLVLEKTAPENATVGTPLDYRIIVRNDGDATAYDVVVEDDVTPAAQVDKAYPQSELDTVNRKLVWRFAEIPPGERQEITVRVTPTGEGVMDGVASVKFKSRVKATTVVTAPKIRLQMEGPRDVRMGEEVAYRYIITNEGSGEAREVFIRTELPPTGGLTHPQGNDLEYEIQSMKPGDQREITLVVIAAQPGDHQAKAEITVAGHPADQASWRTEVIGAQLQIVRRGPKRRYVGRSATYENIVSNETSVDALDAKVVEQVPQGMRFMGASKGGSYDEAARTVTWRINRLGPGRQELLQLELMPTEAGEKKSIVTVLESVGIQSEDYVSTTIVEDLHNVSATISQLDGPVALGEAFGFTINIDNRGTADATDVELSVEVPEEIEVIGAGSREVPAELMGGNVVKYNLIVRIEPNRKQSFELKLRGKKPVRNGVVKARLQYKQMNEPMVISESVTIYSDNL
ncbi:MAG: hypothetical protein R3C59_01590 [Planctomycetaceae bacterium]